MKLFLTPFWVYLFNGGECLMRDCLELQLNLPIHLHAWKGWNHSFWNQSSYLIKGEHRKQFRFQSKDIESNESNVKKVHEPRKHFKRESFHYQRCLKSMEWFMLFQ